jgi:putative hemolysin
MEMLIILVLIILNGVFAMSELAVVSARKARLQQWADTGDGKALTALELADSPNRFLATVQIGITLVGILAGAFGEATIAETLVIRLSSYPLLEPYSKVISLAVVVLGITYLSLVIGELVPKRLALYSPERIARAVAVPMNVLSLISFPVVRLLSVSTDVIMRLLLRGRASPEPPVTEEEIKVLIDKGTQAGVFEVAEQDMVAGVFRLNDRTVDALMTPRTEIVWLDLGDTSDEIQHKFTSSGYSRFPVCQGNLDNVLGVVQIVDLLARRLEGQPVDLSALLQAPQFVPETASASGVLELFKESGVSLALVIDEYGGIQGLVTVDDIVKEIVGDIELDRPKIIQREDGSWLIDGMLPVDEFKELFEISKLPGERRDRYQTVGGFVMSYLGRIPSSADHFETGGLYIEVIDMDGKRVDKVLVMPLK